ncbi:MAG: RNA polymerase-binding protein DksA [Campylobacteraceae bacterium]|nr:RNA polymerase-binding protein DksA [Campylobacteraceae bacterium]
MHESDLRYFKAMLQERIQQIRKNIEDSYNEMEGLNDSGATDELDYASISTDRMIEQALSTQQIKELGEIEFAMSKMANQTYGICEMCEEEISMQRLKVKPHAKFCIVCREIIEKTNRS